MKRSVVSAQLRALPQRMRGRCLLHVRGTIRTGELHGLTRQRVVGLHAQQSMSEIPTRLVQNKTMRLRVGGAGDDLKTRTMQAT